LRGYPQLLERPIMAKRYHSSEGKGFGHGAKLPEGTHEINMDNPAAGMNWDNYPDNKEAVDEYTRAEDAALRRGLKPKKLG